MAPASDPPINTSGNANPNYLPYFADSTTIEQSVVYQDTSGRIGIGTTTPVDKLTVNGNIRLIGQTTHQVQVTGTASSGRLGQDVNGFFFASDTAGKLLSFFTNPGAGIQRRMTITGDGNVGIGTTTPQAKLHVKGGGITIEDVMGAGRLGFAESGENDARIVLYRGGQL